jgi:hypothetical protein
MEQREEAIKQLRPGAPAPAPAPAPEVALVANSPSGASGSTTPIAQVAAASVASPKIAAAKGTKKK